VSARRLLPIAVAAVALLPACRPRGAKPSTLADRELYVSYCARCHGEDGTGDRRSVGLNPRLDLTRSQLARSHSRRQIYQRIAFGYGPMPAFSHKLDPDDIERLTKFCLELAENR
jgi:mono/diheme cytochrome c family protein